MSNLFSISHDLRGELKAHGNHCTRDIDKAVTPPPEYSFQTGICEKFKLLLTDTYNMCDLKNSKKKTCVKMQESFF